MPTKEYIQLLQRLYVYLKRNSGRNVPHGISQITLIDDDDLTRWFVQLLYKDENNADFYVSLELVFNEDVDSEDSAAGGAWGVSAGVGGAGSRHRRPSRHTEPSASATMLAAATMTTKLSAAAIHAADAAPQSAAATSSPHVHRHDTTTTSSPAPPAQPSSSLTSSGAGDKVRAAAERSGGCEVAPSAVASSRDGSNGTRTSDRSTQQQENDDDANSVPTATTPQPYNDFQCRLVGFGEARRSPLTSEGHMALPEDADGAGLMSQDWELTPENMVLLLIALFETLNPFAGDGRVSVDDAERMENLRETVAAWGVGGGGSSTFAGAYSEEEHQLGMEYIRRAHPHLFRRYVGPFSESASAARDGMPSLPAPSDGSAVAATGSDSVRPSASPHGAQTATTTPSLMEFATGHGRGGSGTLAPHVLRDVSHLNTAVYDALVATYAPPLEPSPVSPPPPLCPTLAQQQPHPTAATAKPVVMLLDSPALLADAEGVRLFQSGVRGVQQTVVSATAAGDDKYSAADSTTPDTPAGRDRVGASPEYGGSAFSSLPAPLQQRTPSTMTATPPPSSSAASTSIFAPVMNAERVLRARPPAIWHVAYAPTHPHTAAAASCEKAQPLQQRVAELAEESQATQVLRLAEAGVSCERGAADSAAVPLPFEVHLIGDAGDNVQQARVACVLRNVRVSATAARKLGSTSTTQRPSLRFSLQSSTAPSPTGEIHTCRLPRGLTLHCSNMYLYGHLHVFGNLVLDNCVFVGSLTTEELASVQVSRSHLALMPDDRLLLRQPPYRRGSSDRCRGAGHTHVYRLMPNLHAAAAAAATRGWRRSTQEAKTEKRSGEPSTASCDRDEDEGSDEVASVSGNGEDSGDEGKAAAAAAAVAPSLAAMMAVLRSLILVSNQARLRLVRCAIHPGRNTERTIFAEQNAIVDMAYCTVTAAISSAVSVQGCRAYLEHCFFEGSPTTTAAATSALGGTLTARYCAARHLYFAFCVIAHSVAHFYRCHAEDVVNGFTVDASAATLDGCSADTNHVGAFVLRKAKCILTDDSCGSFPRRCSLLGEAHETARRAVTEALRQKHQETRGGGVVPPAITETESLWTSAAAIAERTARVALLARRHYAEQLPRSDTLSDAAPVTTTASHAPHRRSQTAIGMSSPQQTLGFFGGRFSLEVRDAALKATGVMLMNAHDTSVYAYENSAVELEECVLWSTAEAEEAASAAAATVAAALGSAESPAAAASTAALKLTGRRALTGVDGTSDGQLRSGSPRQRSCGVKVVHASLKARRCLTAGYSFGFAAIQSAQAELQECLVVNAINGYTIDHSQCRLRHCGADTSHVGLFALNGSRVEADSTPHVVGVSSCGRTPPPLICGGVPAVFCGDVYGVEIQSSEVECTGITVLRGRDSGFNAYNGSTLRLSKCLVDMSPTDAASYVFHRPGNGGAAGAAAAVRETNEGRRGSSTNKGDAAGMAGLWTRHLHLDVGLAEELVLCTSDSDAGHAHSRNRLPASALLLAEQQGDTVPHRDEGGEDGRGEATRAAAPAATTTPTTATPPSAPSSAGRVAPAVRTSGVKVWSGSQCHAQDTEVRCVTFGFASLGPETLLDAHHCTAKHVVNGFTSDGGALQLTKCSAGSNHVGVYVLSHAHCVVRRGSYMAKKYGIECRSGVLSLQGHVKIYGFSRIGMYLYDGAHCEADPDCVLDIHALKHAAPGSSADVTAAAMPAPGSSIRSATFLQLSKTQQQQPPMSTASTTSLCSPEDAANVSDLLPACIALDEATAHLPQAVLGGGARCGVTCGDGATGFIGKCIVYDCSLVGVNVFYGAHLTLANALLRCAQQYAVVVHVGGVCRIIQNAEGDETGDDDDSLAVDSSDEGVDRGARGSGGLGNILRRHGPGAAVSAAVRRLRRLASYIVAVPWRVTHQWAGRRTAMSPATAAGVSPTPRHPPSRVADKAQRLSSDASSRWRGETRSAVSPSSATAATASPVAIGGGGAAPLVGDDDDEVGGRRIVPLTSALRRRLKWLYWETCLGAPLPFRLNTLTMPVATVGANGAGPEPGSTAAGVAERRSFSLSPSASGAAAPTSGALAITSVFPPVRPTICGSCVVRGTCTMERVVLRPTNHLPRLFAECSRADPQHRHTDSSNSSDGTTSTGEHGGDSAYASPLLATAAAIKASLAAGRAVAAASARAADGWAALPSVCVLHHLVRQPPGVHVCQQGVLNLTDCIVDASLSPQPCLGARRTGQLVSAVVACEGPYAKLHCDYVRVVRGEGGDEDDRTAFEGGDGGASGAARPATSPAPTRSSALPALSPDAAPPLLAAAPSPRRRGASVAAAAADVATVPLLLVSLVDGAQCTLHMVGASLDDWPYCAYSAESINHDGNVCSDPMMGAEKEDAGNPLGFAGRGEAAAAQLSPARLILARNAGVMLRTTGDTLAEVTYASIASIVASQRSQVRLAHCTVTGMVPIILGSGSSSSLTCCRVVGGARAGPTAAAIRVEHEGDLTLIRSSVWTLSQGLAGQSTVPSDNHENHGSERDPVYVSPSSAPL
ncbi:hypothetical protein CGC21_30170 [Leishmania donovani]|uniref:Uncharacterized protein n=1 Tax=Leishmania donovani TaxID=5661 RepID=A0A504X7M2_LEIDO|nr:hypothetical protein CGC21_30170 [Leishmania donovani]